MSAWLQLEHELDAWRAAGQVATLWWRDDDAAAASPALDRLLAIASSPRSQPVPLALAVIPASAGSDLVERLAERPHASVLQHGYAHVNHTGRPTKKAELGPERPLTLVGSELAAGRRRLQTLFSGHRAPPVLPVIVPPWNRIADAMLRALPGLGFFGISMYRARPELEPYPGLRMVNAHVDIVDWRNGKMFLGTEPAVALLVEHLRSRREGTADREEPTGLLTHHLVHGADAWSFAEELVQRMTAHVAARWIDVRRTFGFLEAAVSR